MWRSKRMGRWPGDRSRLSTEKLVYTTQCKTNIKIDCDYRDKSTKHYGQKVVAVASSNIFGLVDLTR